MDDLQQLNTPSNFHFSGVTLDSLAASEYTLATIVVDISSSVLSFKKELEDCIKTVVTSCKKSPRSENLLVRLITFNRDVHEKHGFRTLNSINVSEYDNSITPSGTTALYTAAQNAIEATYEYGKFLADQDYSVNGVVYIITDGQDNESRFTPSSIRKFIDDKNKSEDGIESLSVILIGVGYGNVSSYLDKFKNDANLTQFVDLEELFAKTSPENALAKLAGYISKSISTASLSLQNGSSNSTVLAF